MKRRLLQYLVRTGTAVIVVAAVVSAVAVGFRLDASAVVIGAIITFLATWLGLIAWYEFRNSWLSWKWWIWHRRMGRWLARRELLRSQGRCLSCGYDLTGNASGTCPECGTRIESATS